jgi:hypothetical protein
MVHPLTSAYPRPGNRIYYRKARRTPNLGADDRPARFVKMRGGRDRHVERLGSLLANTGGVGIVPRIGGFGARARL